MFIKRKTFAFALILILFLSITLTVLRDLVVQSTYVFAEDGSTNSYEDKDFYVSDCKSVDFGVELCPCEKLRWEELAQLHLEQLLAMAEERSYAIMNGKEWESIPSGEVTYSYLELDEILEYLRVRNEQYGCPIRGW